MSVAARQFVRVDDVFLVSRQDLVAVGAYPQAILKIENLFGRSPAQLRPADNLVAMVIRPTGRETASTGPIPVEDLRAILADDFDAVVMLPAFLRFLRRSDADRSPPLVRQQAPAANPL